jgi:adenylate cyclase
VRGSWLNASLVLEKSDRRVPLANGQSWAIGRSDGCAVVLDSRSVSRLHALVQRVDGGDYCLIDLGSRNGSFVNGRRVTIPVTLQNGDRIVCGDERLLFHHPTATASVLSQEVNLRNAPTEVLMTQTIATIVVVDIRDFTPLARAVSEEVLAQTVGTWFLRVGQAAQELGSWSQKYIGDAVMAVWVHDRPAVRRQDLLPALEAVCRIEASTAEISRILPLPGRLRIGAGVNTGPVILGNADYTALGEPVNVAFRLQDATKTLGLGVAVGDSTFQALGLESPEGGRFQRREVVLKGYDVASTAWAISFENLQGFCGAPRSG